MSAAPASGTWEAADRGIWIPVLIRATCVAQRMWWANGATVSASYNVEAGIYRDVASKPGAKIITTGSVAQGTASQVQFADITDTSLAPGLHWLFMSCSSASATFFRWLYGAGSSDCAQMFKFQQASIGPGSAPATATPAEAASANCPMFGFATTASP